MRNSGSRVFSWYDQRVDPYIMRAASRLNDIGRRTPIRLIAYGPPVLYGVLLAVASAVGALDVDLPMWRSIGYLFLMFVCGVSGRIIRHRTDYHPAYAVEKYIETGVWCIVFAQTVFDLAQYWWFPFVWVIVLIGSRIAAFEFIIRRNNAPDRQRVKTQVGLRVMLPDSEIDEMADYVSAFARHGKISTRYREQLIADLGLPSPGRHQQRLREQLAARREQRAHEKPTID